MKEKNKFPCAVIIGFTGLIFLYVPIAALGYAAAGATAAANIIDDINAAGGVVITIVRACFLAHCFAVIFITVNPVLLDLEELFNVPKHFGWKRAALRITILILCFLAFHDNFRYHLILPHNSCSRITLAIR